MTNHLPMDNVPAKDSQRRLWWQLWSGLICVSAIGLIATLIYASDASIGGILLLVLSLILGPVIYFIPAFVAHRRHHKNAVAITVLNIFAGWTFIGWVVALVWSFVE
jgi:uncharacterized membrane-anchored protein